MKLQKNNRVIHVSEIGDREGDHGTVTMVDAERVRVEFDNGTLGIFDREDDDRLILEGQLTGATLVDTKRFSRFAELDALARERGISRTELVEIAVNSYLSNHPVPLDHWLDPRCIRVDNPPDDLGDPRNGR
jgi:Ribbon-helix-helix protein, copG family